jgi:hypothetical protein
LIKGRDDVSQGFTAASVGAHQQIVTRQGSWQGMTLGHCGVFKALLCDVYF